MSTEDNNSDQEAKRDRNVRDAFRSLVESAISQKDTSSQLDKLKQAILISGFFTEGNQNAVDDLRYAQGSDYSKSWGLCVGEPAVLLSDIIHALEEEAIPRRVAQEFPRLTQREWESAMRITMMILSSHEL